MARTMPTPHRNLSALPAWWLCLASLSVALPSVAEEDKSRLDQLEQRVKDLEEKFAEFEKKTSRSHRGRPQPTRQSEAFDIPVQKSPILGNPKAAIHVVVFADFQCPFCARLEPVLQELVQDESLQNQVNVVFKHFPLSFHAEARSAAKAALAAREQGDAYFWTMASKLFANQRELTSENFSLWAGELGLDVEKFEQDLKTHDEKYEAVIKADMALGTSKANIRGTPTVLVNGWLLRERTVEGVIALIQEKKLGARSARLRR